MFHCRLFTKANQNMEPKNFQVFIVREDSPAFQVIKRHLNQKRPFRSGKIIPISDDEFKSFQEDFIYIEIQRGRTGDHISPQDQQQNE